MTKQDYEALAALLKVNRCHCDGCSAGTNKEHETIAIAFDNLARDMAQYMSRNPHFDQAKFLAAAGVA